QAEDGIRDRNVTGVQTCALPILVYGEPITYGKQCIVPVVEVSYSFGVGSGEETSQDDEENEKTNETMLEIGEGGGGHISVKPVEIGRASCRERVEMSVITRGLSR